MISPIVAALYLVVVGYLSGKYHSFGLKGTIKAAMLVPLYPLAILLTGYYACVLRIFGRGKVNYDNCTALLDDIENTIKKEEK
ncbi:hypothetical protein KPN4_121 [Klebsiella phage KPN4]|uniref:Uncharacterized protein n=2 Tax=Sugarlandvirus TaxID=2560233 RepID=A0A5B9NAT0_9CAUD|nr:hypothetical protein CPT_Spivey_177 [Klebsiella phage Spivey]QEG11307.1 hypothetical protein KPN4_121 [Klebsiella phage KPN4]